MSYAYLFKYIIIGDTGEKVFLNCAIWRIFQQVSFPPFVCVQYSERKHVLLSCLGLRWLSDVVMANKYLYLLIIFQSSHIFFLLIWFWCQIISWNCSMPNVILCNFKISWICSMCVKLKFTHLQKLREIAVCHTYIFHSFSENLVKLLAVSHKNPITIRDKLRPQIRLVPTKFFDLPTPLLSIFISLLSLSMSNLFYFFFSKISWNFPMSNLFRSFYKKNCKIALTNAVAVWQYFFQF